MELTPALSLSNAQGDEASPEDHYRHRGFFLRPDLGLGYLSLSEPTGTSYGTLQVSGLAGSAGLSLGGAVASNVILAAHLYDAVAVKPGVSFSSGPSGTSSATLTGFGFGPELDFYLMPANVYLGFTVGVTTLSVSVDGASVSASAGPGAKVAIGKEWFVGDTWGLGAAVGISYASNKDTNGQGIGTWVFTVAFSATYNRFRDDRGVDADPDAPSPAQNPADTSSRHPSTAWEEGASPAPSKDLRRCGRAYDAIDDLADAYTEWNKDREPLVDKPARPAFLAVCGDLPPDTQACLLLPYGNTHRPDCAEAFDSLPRRERLRLDGLFLKPAASPP